MQGYTKLFGSIVASTIWDESKETKIVWITMLALANRGGIVEASIPGLAALSRVTVDECKAALTALLTPDPYSRTKDYEGRRIEEVEGGWKVLNHAKYRAKMSADQRREYLRIKQAESRAKKKSVNTDVNSGQQTSTPSTQAEAHAEAEAMHERVSTREVPNLSAVLSHAQQIGLAEWKARDWFDEMEGCGWLDFNSRPIRSWKHVLNRVKSKWEGDGRPTGPPQSKHANPTNPSGAPLSAHNNNANRNAVQDYR